ncbi:MAG: DUF2141 domain-containing protein [Pirellulaceae bacterium]|nr:DUF2141 domain-containing protein [Pirellulaceae bacterium]
MTDNSFDREANVDDVMDRDLFPRESTNSDSPYTQPSLWNENYGNLLLALVLLILLIGFGLLTVQHFRGVDNPIRDFGSVGALVDDGSQFDAIVENDGPNITIRAVGAANDKGVIRLAFYDADKRFNEPALAFWNAQQLIETGVAQWELSASRFPERFAIAAFHDENSDGVLNRNAVGVATERYGFSNHAWGNSGPPSFSQAAVDCPTDNSTIEIFIR